MALTPSESAVLALYDKGVTPAIIARRLGMGLRTVRTITGRYADAGESSNYRHRLAMQLGSRALLQAMQAAEALRRAG